MTNKLTLSGKMKTIQMDNGENPETLKRIAEIVQTSCDIETEKEVEDAFSYTSGHYTKNTGTSSVTLFGIPDELAAELRAILKEGK